MAFYLIPPLEVARLSSLESDVKSRLLFLRKVFEHQGNSVQLSKNIIEIGPEADCLIVGSRRDIATHYVIRLAVSLLQQNHLKEFWISSEAKLFEHHLTFGGPEAIRKCLIDLASHVAQALRCQKLLSSYRVLLSEAKKIAECLLIKFHSCQHEDCKHFIDVPWTLVKELVSTRRVELHSGVAKVPCHLVAVLLSCLFKELLHEGINQMKDCSVPIQDERMLSIIKIIYHSYRQSVGISFAKSKWSLLRHRDVYKERENFPLCMQLLHKQLARARRVRHHKRIRYSLFLKDAGLSVEENLNFWKSHYSSPRCVNSGCLHEWSGASARRYEYSIRHMYGHEGKRTNYRSHSCAALQAYRPQPQESGGCPFGQVSTNYLENELTAELKDIWPAQQFMIIAAAKSGNPSLACGYYLSSSLHSHRKKPLSHLHSHAEIASRTECVGSLRRTRSAYSAPESEAGNCLSDESRISRWNRLKGNKFESCSTCNYDSIPAVTSFLSPVEYYRMRKCLKI